LQILLLYVKLSDLPELAEILTEQEVRDIIDGYGFKSSINGLQSQITGVTNDIAILENTLSLKEKVANKSNEIDDSTQLYPSNKAVQTELKVRDANIQQLAINLQNTADLIPYITQSKGNSTEDVMSQDAVTKGFNYIESLMSVALGEIDFPEIDLSEYLTGSQVHSAIFDVTGDLLELETDDKTSLVGAINENKGGIDTTNTRIDNNITSITGLQTDLSAEITNRTNADNTLQTQINTINAQLTGLETLLSEV